MHHICWWLFVLVDMVNEQSGRIGPRSQSITTSELLTMAVECRRLARKITTWCRGDPGYVGKPAHHDMAFLFVNNIRNEWLHLARVLGGNNL